VTQRPAKKRKNRPLVLAAALLVAVIGGAGIIVSVRYHFSEARIAAAAAGALERLLGAELQTRRAEVDFPQSLVFHDVEVRVPPEKLERGEAFSSEDAVLLTAKRLVIRFDRSRLLKLKFRIDDVAVQEPRFHLTRDVDRDLWNWQLLFVGREREGKRPFRFKVGPQMSLADGQVTLTEIVKGKRLVHGRVNFTADAIPGDDLYHVAVETWTAEARGPRVSLDFDPRSGQVISGAMALVDWQNVELAIPQPYQEWCRRFALAGRIGISQISYANRQSGKVVMILEDARSRIPLSAKELEQPDHKWFADLTGISGKITFDEDGVRIGKLVGRLNGAPCEVSGRYRGNYVNLQEGEFELHIKAEGLECPDYTDPNDHAMIEEYFPRKLRNFFNDFRPRGKVDLELTITKAAGADGAIGLVGKIAPRGLSAEYRKFPYRADDLHGQVLLVDGGFVINGLTGLASGGPFTMKGTISEPSKHAQVDLQISSPRVEVDERLYRALSPRHRKIWDMFQPSGGVRMKVHLVRPAGPDQKWSRTIEADFIDGSACYEAFKYPLTELAGVLAVETDVLKLQKVRGRHGPATVTLDGQVDGLNSPRPEVRLEVRARDVTVDRDLIAALPESAGRIIDDCRLTGRGDLNGSIEAMPGQPLEYQFTCELKEGGVCYKDFPYPVKNLRGRLTIEPEQVRIDGVFAREGEQTVEAQGRLALGGQDQGIELTIDADNVPVDSDLYAAMDERLQTIWRDLRPEGRIRVKAELSRQGQDPWTWRLGVDLAGTSIQYGELPRISGQGGRAVFAPGQVELSEVVGRTDDGGEVRCTGRVAAEEKELRCNLQLGLADLPISRELLRSAGVGKMASMLEWQPGGKASGQLDEVAVAASLEDLSRQKWELKGRLDFVGAALESLAVDPVNLSYRGRIGWDRSRGLFSMDGEAELSRFNWKDRAVSDISCRMIKPQDKPELQIEDLHGWVGLGEVSGLARLTLLPDETRYGVQLTLDNLPVEKVLTIDNGSSGPIKGRMRGEVYMLGTLGARYVREAGGNVQVAAAEALKVPLLGEVYKSIRQEPPNLASFHDLAVEFAVEQHRMIVRRVELTGQTLSMFGYGTMNLSNDRLRLSLIASNESDLTRIPVLADLVRRARRDLTEVQVTGTLDDPTIRATPLRHLSDTFKEFLQGKRAHDEMP